MNTQDDNQMALVAGAGERGSMAVDQSERQSDAATGAPASMTRRPPTRMEIHEVAGIFPLMEEDDLVKLEADIRETGLQQPIWTHDGKIIDGRNRYLACLRAGVEPAFRTWDGKGDLLGFVVSLNLHRRHLSTSQRAIIAAEVAKRKRGRQPNAQNCASMTVPQAAKAFGVSPRLVNQARAIAMKGASELIANIKANRMTVSKAAMIVRQSPGEQSKTLVACKASQKGGGRRRCTTSKPARQDVLELGQHLMLAFRLARLCGFKDIEAAVRKSRQLFKSRAREGPLQRPRH